VEGGQEWFVSQSDKVLIDKLLLERISLSGICRVGDVSEQWLLSYLKGLYGNLPDDLNADQTLPTIAVYLSDSMDEEIERIAAIKKSIALEEYTKLAEKEGFTDESDCFLYLSDIENNDLLVNQLYSKEPGVSVQYYGIQLEEMGTFVGNKKNKQWLWLALNPVNRQITAFDVGGRGSVDRQLF